MKSQKINCYKFASELDPCLEFSNNVQTFPTRKLLILEAEAPSEERRLCISVFIALGCEMCSFAFKWTEKDESINLGFIKRKQGPVHSLHSPKKSPLVKTEITSTNSWVCERPCCQNAIV